MQFLVFSRDRIKNFTLGKPHIVISITDPNSEFASIHPNESCLGILRLKFHDINNEARKHIEETYKTSPKANKMVYFSKKEASQIVDFVRAHLDLIEVIVCQCDAGISRSAGTAAALSKYITGSDEFYFKHYLPNSLVYNTILEEFHKDENN
jgi:predicted protein tyrosine phosphatase